MRNFGFVRDRLKSSCCAPTSASREQAWEVREEQIDARAQPSRASAPAGTTAHARSSTRSSTTPARRSRGGANEHRASVERGSCPRLLGAARSWSLPTLARLRARAARWSRRASAPRLRGGSAAPLGARRSGRPAPPRPPRGASAGRPDAPPPREEGAGRPPPPTPEQVAALAELQKEADAYEKAGARLPRDHHAHRPAPLRGPQATHPLRARPRDRDREEGAASTHARRRSAGSRCSSRATAAPNAHPENTPDAMFRLAALYEERARADETEITDEELARRPAAGDHALQARHPRVPEVPRARRHLLLPRPRAQRLEPPPRGAAGVALARLPQQLPVPGRDRSDGPEQGRRAPLPQDHDASYWTRLGAPPSRRRSRPARSKPARPRRAAGRARRRAGDDLDRRDRVPEPVPDDCVADPAEDARRARSRATSPRSGG